MSLFFSYLGIRYGRAKRFEKPTPVEPWTETYNATHWRDACPQFGIGVEPNKLPFYTETISEDCLFLTVTKPHNSHETGRPVMFWIHGGMRNLFSYLFKTNLRLELGGYSSGSIFTVAYDGRYLASQGDVVVVTVQYRLV